MNEEPKVDVQLPVEQTVVDQPTQESNRDYNLRILRERAEAAERRAAELERIAAQNTPKQERQDEDDLDVPDDMYLEARHLKKTQRKNKQEQSQTKQELAELKNLMAEMKLRSKFSDFDAIVTDENMKKLEREKPSHFRSILHNPDMYDKGEIAYEAIRSYIARDKYEEVDKKIEANKAKPKSAATVGPQTANSPLMRVGDYDRRVLTEERKEQLRRQMEHTRKYG